MAAKILLVEDDNNLREIYEARLQAEGYTIITAKDGEEALVVAKAERPDLIVSDVMMPRISGFEMLDILRNTEGLKDTKVVMLTALGQADDKNRANSLGADRYLVKSQVTLEDIVKAAHELIEGPASIASAGDPAQSVPTPSPAPVTTPVMSQAPSTPMPSPSTSGFTAMPSSNPVPSVPTPPTFIPVTPAPVQAAPSVPQPSQQPDPIPPVAPVTPPMPAPTAAHTPYTMPSAFTSMDALLGQSTPTQAASNLQQPMPNTAPQTQSSQSLTPTPAVATTPVTLPHFPAADGVANAPTVAEEKATMGTQISDFENKPEAVSTEDDAVLAKAVSDLTASVPQPSQQPDPIPPVAPVTPPMPTPPVASQQAPAQPVVPPVPIQPPTPAPEATHDLQPGGYKAGSPYDSASTSSKKVIQPLKSDPKPGIHELLAREEAKDIMNNPPLPPDPAPTNPSTDTTPSEIAPPHTVITPTQQMPTDTPAPQHHDFDPNNIAL